MPVRTKLNADEWKKLIEFLEDVLECYDQFVSVTLPKGEELPAWFHHNIVYFQGYRDAWHGRVLTIYDGSKEDCNDPRTFSELLDAMEELLNRYKPVA